MKIFLIVFLLEAGNSGLFNFQFESHSYSNRHHTPSNGIFMLLRTIPSPTQNFMIYNDNSLSASNDEK